MKKTVWIMWFPCFWPVLDSARYLDLNIYSGRFLAAIFSKVISVWTIIFVILSKALQPSFKPTLTETFINWCRMVQILNSLKISHWSTLWSIFAGKLCRNFSRCVFKMQMEFNGSSKTGLKIKIHKFCPKISSNFH